MNGQRQAEIGVLLLNLGGPEKLADVGPFLYNLFSDRDIIRLGPKWLQKPIAWWIAKRRAPKSRESYRLIGGGSPLHRITQEQGAALAERLGQHGAFQVAVAMRYWRPFADEALAAFAARGIKRIVALTLYPHYSMATTGSSLRDLHAALARFESDIAVQEVASWPEQADYIAALAGTIDEQMAGAGSDVQLVYSAHSLPVKCIEDGDPYLDQLRQTIAAVEKRLGVTGTLCFQSRSGPVEWLSPSTPDMLQTLAAEGCRKVVMVPISFVSDHVETLYEIDMLYHDQAAALGMELVRTESLNTHPRFITGLYNLVLDACRERQWLS